MYVNEFIIIIMIITTKITKYYHGQRCSDVDHIAIIHGRAVVPVVCDDVSPRHGQLL